MDFKLVVRNILVCYVSYKVRYIYNYILYNNLKDEIKECWKSYNGNKGYFPF